MARVANTEKQIIGNILGRVRTLAGEISKEIRDEGDTSGRLDTTYQGTLDASIKSKGGELIKMLRWLVESELALTPPTAYDDTEIDGIDPEIRTHEDGL